MAAQTGERTFARMFTAHQLREGGGFLVRRSVGMPCITFQFGTIADLHDLYSLYFICAEPNMAPIAKVRGIDRCLTRS